MIAKFKYSYNDSFNNIYEEEVTGKINKIFIRTKFTPADTKIDSLYMTIGNVDYEIKPTSEVTFYTKNNEMYVLTRSDGGYALNGVVYSTSNDLYQRLLLIYRNEHIIEEKE